MKDRGEVRRGGAKWRCRPGRWSSSYQSAGRGVRGVRQSGGEVAGRGWGGKGGGQDGAAGLAIIFQSARNCEARASNEVCKPPHHGPRTQPAHALMPLNDPCSSPQFPGSPGTQGPLTMAHFTTSTQPACTIMSLTGPRSYPLFPGSPGPQGPLTIAHSTASNPTCTRHYAPP